MAPVYLHVSNSMQNNDTYGACWSSTDYVNWEYHQMNMGVTAPAFVQVGDKYYLAGNGTPVYVSDTPAGPWEELGKFVLPDGTETGFSDVCFFLDDDGRLYLSYSIGSPIMGCELNPENPCEVLTEAGRPSGIAIAATSGSASAATTRTPCAATPKVRRSSSTTASTT